MLFVSNCVKLDNAGDECYIPVAMAMSSLANDLLILSSEVVDKLIRVLNRVTVGAIMKDEM